MENDWPLALQVHDLETRRASIMGNWKIFYRCCHMNAELNMEWHQLNIDIWVRLFTFFISFPFFHNCIFVFLLLLDFPLVCLCSLLHLLRFKALVLSAAAGSACQSFAVLHCR